MEGLLIMFATGLVIWLAGAAFGIGEMVGVGAFMAVLVLGVAAISWLRGIGREERK